MNGHEIERIAAAMNQARPDWPVKQLTTLLGDPRLSDRPRRDVFVALAWVACESGTASPYRVLEAGPWWRAAGVEGSAQRREPYDARTFCHVCGKPSDRHPESDHPFASIAEHKARLRPIDVHATVTALRELAAVGKEPRAPAPDREHTPDPRAEAVRAAMAPKEDA